MPARENKKTMTKRLIALLLCLLTLLCVAVPGQQSAASAEAPAAAAAPAEGAAAPSPAVADASQMTAVEDVVEEGMVPVPAGDLLDGEYSVTVECSSSMFRVVECTLSVHSGSMEATLVMSGTSYLCVFPGTALEAASAAEDACIPYAVDAEGRHCFTIPVPALDAGVPCAAFSKNKELWYDRTLLFRADSLPLTAFREGFFATAESLGLADGAYTVAVALSGGSGRAKISSPASLTVADGRCTLSVRWGSSNYDYMKVDGEQFLPLPGEEVSVFEIPVPFFDRPFAVIADTVAMSQPHEIAYRLLLDSSTLQKEEEEDPLPLSFAQHFRVQAAEGGALLLTLGEDQRFFLIPRESSVPEALPQDVPVLRIPLEGIYAASSSVPDLFLHCGALPALRFTATAESSWKLPEVLSAMEEGSLLYAGKYSAPDYELLLEEGCSLAVENTMILHNPKVKEKLEALGIPVLIEYSSYEPHPLGRVEWIKLWGLLSGHREEAEAFFEAQAAVLNSLASEAPTGKTVAFFHITSSGAAAVRKQADYVTQSILLAGGASPFTSLPDDGKALSTVTVQMEAFVSDARDADVLIYNSTVSGELRSLDDLLAKSGLFSSFRAVQSGNVWCTEQSMFQRSSATAAVIAEIHAILTGTADAQQLRYFRHVQ